MDWSVRPWTWHPKFIVNWSGHHMAMPMPPVKDFPKKNDGWLKEHTAIDPHPDKIREANWNSSRVGRLRPALLGNWIAQFNTIKKDSLKKIMKIIRNVKFVMTSSDLFIHLLKLFYKRSVMTKLVNSNVDWESSFPVYMFHCCLSYLLWGSPGRSGHNRNRK